MLKVILLFVAMTFAFFVGRTTASISNETLIDALKRGWICRHIGKNVDQCVDEMRETLGLPAK